MTFNWRTCTVFSLNMGWTGGYMRCGDAKEMMTLWFTVSVPTMLDCGCLDCGCLDCGCWCMISQRFSKGSAYHINYHRLSAWQLIGMQQIALIAFIWSEATHVSWYLCQRMRKGLASVRSFHSSAGIRGSINEEVHLKNFEAKKHAVSGYKILHEL